MQFSQLETLIDLFKLNSPEIKISYSFRNTVGQTSENNKTATSTGGQVYNESKLYCIAR